MEATTLSHASIKTHNYICLTVPLSAIKISLSLLMYRPSEEKVAYFFKKIVESLPPHLTLARSGVHPALAFSRLSNCSSHGCGKVS